MLGCKSQRSRACPHPHLRLLVLRAGREYHSVVLSHPDRGFFGTTAQATYMHMWAGVVMAVEEPFPQSWSRPFDKDKQRIMSSLALPLRPSPPQFSSSHVNTHILPDLKGKGKRW